MRPRILFVGLGESPHASRWVSQLADQGWDIHLFSINASGIHPGFRNVTVHGFLFSRPRGLGDGIRLRGVPWPLGSIGPGQSVRHGLELRPRWFPWAQSAGRLAGTIRRVKPDIVHSLEIFTAGSLTLEAKRCLGGAFPTWIATNWGHDVYLFGRLDDYKDKIRAVLAECDYYSAECQRDVRLAKEMGVKGEILPVLPNCGGFDLGRCAGLRQAGPTSGRRLILLKGFQDWHGRALFALRAVQLCADELKGYRIALYSADSDVKMAAELVSKSTSIPIDIVPWCSHEEMLRLHGSARIHIGINITDGISISVLEAMVMGAFPIQSCTACADEWIVQGQSGFIVPPEDPHVIADAIRRAVSDDALVDQAAEINTRIAKERLDENVIRPQVIAMYKKILERHQRPGVS